jgi:hypothetical protein
VNLEPVNPEPVNPEPREAIVARLSDRLLRARNPDGGWGYYAGKASRLEPTCWAVLALGNDESGDVLRRWPAASGLLLERHDGQPNLAFHGLGLLALLARKSQHQEGNEALIRGLERVKGLALADRGVNRQNNRIQAWPWMDGTFSWVEPTAYCLLALKKARREGIRVDQTRIQDGEALLLDRCGLAGGWNYGNSNMLGQELPSYIPTTALGVLALQDRSDHDAVRVSVDYLERDALSERSSLALSLAAMALGVLDRPRDRVRVELIRQVPTTIELGGFHTLAMALYALRMDGGYAAVTL